MPCLSRVCWMTQVGTSVGRASKLRQHHSYQALLSLVGKQGSEISTWPRYQMCEYHPFTSSQSLLSSHGVSDFIIGSGQYKGLQPKCTSLSDLLVMVTEANQLIHRMVSDHAKLRQSQNYTGSTFHRLNYDIWQIRGITCIFDLRYFQLTKGQREVMPL